MTSERPAAQPDEPAPAKQAAAGESAADRGPAPADSPEVYSADEAEVIAERLAALGYIE